MPVRTDLIRQIDDLTRADLVNLRDWYFFWLLVATGIVAFGILLEGPEVVFETIGLVRRIPRSEHERPSWMVWLASVGWLFIVIGVTGEGVAEALVSKADGLIQTFNAIVVTATQHEIVQAEELAGNARTSSAEAANAAKRAVKAAKLAENVARGARQEADTFERRLASAEQKADEAESHLAEAVRRAVEATAALDRIRLPRLLTHIPELAATLKPFEGTEYTFESVFGDDESMQLLKQIDGMLQLAGWKRQKRTSAPLGIPAFSIPGIEGVVNMGAHIGVYIVVESSESLQALQLLPIDKLPPHVRIAVLLNGGIFSNLSPPEDSKDFNVVAIDPGTSKVIRINVGRKP